MSETRVLGIVGWSGSGKTTLVTRLIPVLVARGLRIAALKHAHHSFDIDHPGKDSYEFRAAGAAEVIVASSRRWAQMHELTGEAEPTLAALLLRFSACDLVLIEGYKEERHPKLEVFRPSLGLTPLHPDDPRIVAVASDDAVPAARVPVVDLNNIPAIAELVGRLAEPLAGVIGRQEAQEGGT